MKPSFYLIPPFEVEEWGPVCGLVYDADADNNYRWYVYGDSMGFKAHSQYFWPMFIVWAKNFWKQLRWSLEFFMRGAQ